EYSRTTHDWTQFGVPLTTVDEAIGYAYDVSGNLVRQEFLELENGSYSTAANTSVVEMRYNARGEMVERGLNGLFREAWVYDTHGRLTETTAGDGIAKYFAYDALGNQTLVLTATGSDAATTASLAAQTRDSVFALFNDATQTPDFMKAGVSEFVSTLTEFDARNMAISVIEPERQLNNIEGSQFHTLTTSRTYNAFG
ncbi:hypothetical protein RMQ97_15430, partial [Maricaulis sp. D1M11]